MPPHFTGQMIVSKRAGAATVFTPLVVKELEQIERDLGGRQTMVGMLVLAPLTSELRYVLGLLGDPQHEKLPLADICARGNILPGELLKSLAGAALLKGKLLASQKIASGIAAVAEDVMAKAVPYEATCNICQGLRVTTPEPTKDDPNPGPQTCYGCEGLGVRVYQPEFEKQKLALEMAQLLPKGGGLNIALQQNTTMLGGGGAGMSTMERLQEVTDRILYGDAPLAPPEVVEGEVTPDPDPAERGGDGA